MHRKAAIRLLGWVGPKLARRSRKRLYGPAVVEVLRCLWEVGDRMCGKLLVAAIPDLMAALERHGELRVSPQVRTALLAVSPATVDRLLHPFRLKRRRQPLRASAASPSLKSQVPIRTWSQWQGVKPGSPQADLVLHCGESVEGFYLTTLTTVDVATGWTELQAIWGMGKGRVGGALHHIRQRLPFPLRELHTDNGSEFINHLLVPWCLRQKISLTRGRSYRKNDQAYVEQKNWLNVCRHVGHDRYNSKAAYAAFQQLYALVCLHVNFFRPVRKLVAKERQGAKLLKRYDQPMTPYQRLLASDTLNDAARQALHRQFLSLNPAQLQRRIDLALQRLWSTAAHHQHNARKVG
jgi:transposase InsO family protein